jgi:small conductance mechanosensitive channel
MPQPFDLTWATIIHDAARYGMVLLGAILILVGGWILADWASRTLRAALLRQSWLDPTLVPLLASIARYAVLVGVALAVLEQFGIQVTSVIAVIGAAGLAIGLALQGSLTNVAAGAMLLFLRPFRVGDNIVSGSFSGAVEEIGLFMTIIRTAENRIIYLPNNLLFSGAITNESRQPLRQTQRIAVRLAAGADVGRALELLQRIAGEATSRVPDAPLAVGLQEINGTATVLTVQLTTLAADADKARSELNARIAREFAAAKLPLAPAA